MVTVLTAHERTRIGTQWMLLQLLLGIGQSQVQGDDVPDQFLQQWRQCSLHVEEPELELNGVSGQI